jgi:hypothetical protein
MDKGLPRNLNLTLVKTDPPIYEERKIFLRKGSSETLEHVFLKIMAFLINWESKNAFVIEPKYKFRRFRPDLISFRPPIDLNQEEEIDCWIECKKVKLNKLMTLSRALSTSTILWVHWSNYFERNQSKIYLNLQKALETNLSVIGIKFVYGSYDTLIKDSIRKSETWTFEKKENILNLTRNQMNVEVNFYRI